MGLFGPKRTTVGLDIGTGFVKLAEVGHGGDRPEVRKLRMRPIPAGAVVNGEVIEPARVVDVLRELVDEAGIGTREVVTALGGHDVFIRRVRVPRSNGDGAGPAIRREAARHIPFDISEVQTGFQVLGGESDSSNIEVLLVAAKRERVEERVTLLAEAGIGAVVLDVESFALCNALTHNYPGTSTDLVALVDCGHDATSISVLHDGVPVLVRDHHFGLRGLAESLVQEHGLSPDQASEAVRGGRRPDGFDGVLEEAAGLVGTAIERAAAVLRTRNPGLGVGRVFLCGGGACVPAIVRSLGRTTKVETLVANPFELVAVRSGAPGRVVLSEAAPLFFLALGLALRTA